MAEGTVRDSSKVNDSRGDAEDGYSGLRDTNGNGGERDRLVKQDGGESVRYTDDVMADTEMAVEEHQNPEKQKWRAPDGGWAYVVMVSAFFISFIVDGITYSFGILLGDLEEAFQAPKSEITLAGSIQIGAYLMIGPVVSALTNAYGCRAVIIAGTLISAFAYIVTLWIHHVYVLIIVYGLIGGIGYGLMYLPSIVAVSIYFDRKRTLATCITLCGSGVGTIVLAPVTEFLLNEFSWRWTIFLQAAIILNGLVLGGLIRPLYFDDAEEVEVEEAAENNRTAILRSTDGQQEFEIIEIREVGRVEKGVGDGDGGDGIGGGVYKKREGRRESSDFYQRRRRSSLSGRRRSSVDDGHWLVVGRRTRRASVTGQRSSGPKWMTIWEAIPGITLTNHDEEWTIVLLEIQRLKEETEVGDSRGQRSSITQAVEVPSTPDIPEVKASMENTKMSVSARETAEERFIQSEPVSRPRAHTIADTHKMNRRRGSHWDTPISLSSPHAHSRAPLGLSFIGLADLQLSESLDDTRAQITARSLNNDPPGPDQDAGCGSCWAKMGESFGEAMAEMLNCSILKNKLFWFVLLGNLFVMLGFYVPYVYISDRAVDAGIDETQAAFLISILGGTNVISRAVTGIMMHFWRMDTVLASGLSLVVASVAVTGCGLLDSYAMLALSAGLFGFSSAVFVALCSVLLCDILGINNLANAFGFVILFRGVASSLGPPIAGALIDATGRYNEAFYLAGLMILLGGLCHLLLYIIYQSPCRRCFGARCPKVTFVDDPDTGSAGNSVRGSEGVSVERV